MSRPTHQAGTNGMNRASYWQDKVVLVTGGSAGFGRALATVFAQRNARVVITARHSDRLGEAAAAIGQGVIGIAADVTRNEQVQALFTDISARFGRLDALVNNVGRSTRGAIADTSAEKFGELIELNFLSAVRCTQLAIPLLQQSKGHIVLIGSLASKIASSYLGAYPASKFPLSAYAQQLRLELGALGVHTLLVCPGPIAREDAGHRYQAEASEIPASAQKPGGGVRLKGIDPHRLAERVVRACERRSAELVVPSSARWLAAVSQLWPSLADAIVRRMTNK